MVDVRRSNNIFANIPPQPESRPVEVGDWKTVSLHKAKPSRAHELSLELELLLKTKEERIKELKDLESEIARLHVASASSAAKADQLEEESVSMRRTHQQVSIQIAKVQEFASVYDGLVQEIRSGFGGMMDKVKESRVLGAEFLVGASEEQRRMIDEIETLFGFLNQNVSKVAVEFRLRAKHNQDELARNILSLRGTR